jgi:histone deacetylase 11
VKQQFLRVLFVGIVTCPSLTPFAVSRPPYPIVYCEEYNIGSGFLGKIARKLHPFDGTKYGRIANYVADGLGLKSESGALLWYRPLAPLTEQQKLLVHTREYLQSLERSSTISGAVDCGYLLALLPCNVLKKLLLRPMEWAAAGTVLAAQLALEYGWAINIGAGYHHAAASKGEGGCIFSDVPIALQVLWQKHPDLKVLIVDLDAHQGNGFERVLSNDPRVVYFDVFNPHAGLADDELIRTSRNIVARPLQGGYLSYEWLGITFPSVIVEQCVNRNIGDDEYLLCMKEGLQAAFIHAQNYFGKQPDLIVYNAGSDINSNDVWGCMNVSEAGILERDEYVFTEAAARAIPICMVLSGSYYPRSAEVISESILNIVRCLTGQCSESH